MKFEKPIAELIKFDLEDICTTSGETEPTLPSGTGEVELPWD